MSFYRFLVRTQVHLLKPSTYHHAMSSKVDSSINSAGLKSEETKALPERTVQAHEQPIIIAIKEVREFTCELLKDSS